MGRRGYGGRRFPRAGPGPPAQDHRRPFPLTGLALLGSVRLLGTVKTGAPPPSSSRRGEDRRARPRHRPPSQSSPHSRKGSGGGTPLSGRPDVTVPCGPRSVAPPAGQSTRRAASTQGVPPSRSRRYSRNSGRSYSSCHEPRGNAGRGCRGWRSRASISAATWASGDGSTSNAQHYGTSGPEQPAGDVADQERGLARQVIGVSVTCW